MFGMLIFFYLPGKSYVDKELLQISCVYVNCIKERLVNMIERYDFILYFIVHVVNFLYRLVHCKHEKGSPTSHIGLVKTDWTQLFKSISYLM